MNADAYKEHLRAKDVAEQAIGEQIRVIQAFEAGLSERGAEPASVDKKALYEYARQMAAEKTNTPENFETLIRYAHWAGLRALYIALMEITDCSDAMDKLADTVEAKYGAEMRKQIFTVPPPPLGADEEERCAYTRAVTERMAALLTTEEARPPGLRCSMEYPPNTGTNRTPRTGRNSRCAAVSPRFWS